MAPASARVTRPVPGAAGLGAAGMGTEVAPPATVGRGDTGDPRPGNSLPAPPARISSVTRWEVPAPHPDPYESPVPQWWFPAPIGDLSPTLRGPNPAGRSQPHTQGTPRSTPRGSQPHTHTPILGDPQPYTPIPEDPQPHILILRGSHPHARGPHPCT